jgi:DNA repair exonuclease SbcCD ATPase subunit
MSASEPQTCGKGLAENSALPAKLGELISAMAENLEAHWKALDLTDQNSRSEYEAYEKLLKELRQIAAQLSVTASEMAEYRDLPMGRHDEKAMTHPRLREAFENFVQHKRELWELLEQTEERDHKLLEVMRNF